MLTPKEIKISAKLFCSFTLLIFTEILNTIQWHQYLAWYRFNVPVLQAIYIEFIQSFWGCYQSCLCPVIKHFFVSIFFTDINFFFYFHKIENSLKENLKIVEHTESWLRKSFKMSFWKIDYSSLLPLESCNVTILIVDPKRISCFSIYQFFTVYKDR